MLYDRGCEPHTHKNKHTPGQRVETSLWLPDMHDTVCMSFSAHWKPPPPPPLLPVPVPVPLLTEARMRLKTFETLDPNAVVFTPLPAKPGMLRRLLPPSLTLGAAGKSCTGHSL